MQQKRLLLALLISVVILALWSYFFVKPAPPPPANQPTASASPSPAAATATVSPVVTPTPGSTPTTTAVSSQPQSQPQRMVVIKTPLYEAKLDSRGAEVVSWIIKKNKDSGREIHSVAGTKTNPAPLELVSAEGLKRQPRQAPLQLVTGDSALDGTLMNSGYAVEGVDSASGNVELNLASNEKKQITFSLRDPATGLDVSKTIVFSADNYTIDLDVKIKRGDQTVPAKLKVGPSIGDQGVKHYTFYSVAPEGIASFGDKAERHTAASINEHKSTPDHLALPGAIDWAGIGDTYFAMVAIPSKRLEGLEFKTVQYDYQANGKPEKRYLIEALVPIPTDGSRTVVYVGPKDHFIL